MIKTLKRGGDAQAAEFVLSKSSGVADQPKDFEWVAKNIPCQAACPAGTDIPGYLGAIARGEHDEAYRINLVDNVFPAVLGRVCTRPCEPECRHGWEGLGEPVAICFSKRSAEMFSHSKKPVVLPRWFEDTGKSIAVVGGGVAGLTAARQLALMGHAVTVFEQSAKAGGMMVQGIPSFRLPRKLVEREVEQVALCGVDIRCGVKVGVDIPLQKIADEHDAVILAAGTLKPNIPDLPGSDLKGVQHGLPFLGEANTGKAKKIGKRVVVVGGGFTAVDCARMAKRLGAETVGMYYRRSRAEMYITPGEIEEMEAEGIGFETMHMPMGYEGKDGTVTAVRFAKVQLGEPDASGRRSPQAVPGSEFTIEADTVLLCTGQTPDVSWVDGVLGGQLVKESKWLQSSPDGSTAIDTVFAAGDFCTGAVSLIDAIGHAKACARRIDSRLMGEERLADVVAIEEAEETGRTQEMDELPRQTPSHVPLSERGLEVEVDLGFDEAAAQTEATRCYLCHYKFEIDNDLCIYCDRCLKVKPVENCIVKVKSLSFHDDGRIQGFEPSTGSRNYNMLFIDQNECIRCGACAEVCPVECITLQKVSRQTVPQDSL